MARHLDKFDGLRMQNVIIQVIIALTAGAAPAIITYYLGKRNERQNNREDRDEKINQLETILRGEKEVDVVSGLVDVVEGQDDVIEETNTMAQKNRKKIDDVQNRIDKLESEIEKLNNLKSRLKKLEDKYSDEDNNR